MKIPRVIIVTFISIQSIGSIATSQDRASKEAIVQAVPVDLTQFPLKGDSIPNLPNIRTHFRNRDKTVSLTISVPFHRQVASMVYFSARGRDYEALFRESSQNIGKLFAADTTQFVAWFLEALDYAMKKPNSTQTQRFDQVRVDVQLKDSTLNFWVFDPIHHLMEFH